MLVHVQAVEPLLVELIILIVTVSLVILIMAVIVKYVIEDVELVNQME